MKKITKMKGRSLVPQEQDIHEESKWNQYADLGLKPFSFVPFLPKS
jgi:hypothetical protein